MDMDEEEEEVITNLGCFSAMACGSFRVVELSDG